MGKEGVEQKVYIEELPGLLDEIENERDWKEALGKILEAYYTAKKYFSFNQIETIERNFQRIEEIMDELTDSKINEDVKQQLLVEKAELIGALPTNHPRLDDRFNIHKLVALKTELAGEGVSKILEAEERLNAGQ